MQKVILAASILFGLYYVFLFDTIPDDFKMVFKLIPMVLFILLALLSTKRTDSYAVFICIGLVFCAIGDYTLQWFIVGLTFFLIGHVFYIVAFTRKNGQTPTAVKIMLGLYGALMSIWLVSTLLGKGETVLAVAVIAYIAIILTMGWTSFRTNNRLAIIAAICFIFSDSVLAVNRFVFDIPAAHELIMLSYYGAQLLFALSIRRVALQHARVANLAS